MSVHPDQFGKVAVFMGGWSAEREISLLSGQAVLEALLAQGVDAHGVDVSRDIVQHLATNHYDRVFNILHGRGGEDGEIQGLLEVLELPYTGSGVKASAVTMDKVLTKHILSSTGLPTPKFMLLQQDSDWQAVVETLGLPVIVKPANEGSSVGMTIVRQTEDLPAAWETAGGLANVVFAEQWIEGDEFTVSILNDEALPSIQLETPNEFYDYEAKYESDETIYLCPSNLNEAEEAELGRLALVAFQTVEATDWGRVDFMRDRDGQFWLIEVNTVPGMTAHSLVPKAAAARGIDFQGLVMSILASSLARGSHG